MFRGQALVWLRIKVEKGRLGFEVRFGFDKGKVLVIMVTRVNG